MRTRFAPSPTGFLHLGHAYSALNAHGLARAMGGEFLVRIEDLDPSRCKAEFEAAIFEDLAWLGLIPDDPAVRQSDRREKYSNALNILADMDLLYPCSCTRGDIQAVLTAPQEGVIAPGVYPGTCRNRKVEDAGPNDAIRVNLSKALAVCGPLNFTETGPLRAGTHRVDPAKLLKTVGDVVLQRRDTGLAAYHLAVVVDDAAQGITHVVRGMDLFEATALQRVLQALLDLPNPLYHHHRLIRDETGKRLAKRDDARAIRHYRADGMSPEDVLNLCGVTEKPVS